MADFTEKIIQATNLKVARAVSTIRTTHDASYAERLLVDISETLEAATRLGVIRYSVGRLDDDPTESALARMHSTLHAMFVLGLFVEAGDYLEQRLNELCEIELPHVPKPELDPPEGC